MRHPLPVPALSLALAIFAASAPPAAATPPTPAARVAAQASPLPWIANDWPRALSLAKERKVPIFVENWAPW